MPSTSTWRKELHSSARDLAVELGDRAAQAENLLALGHIHLMGGENHEAASVLAQARTLVEQLNDPHDLGHVDQGLALLANSIGDPEAGRALLEDVSLRFFGAGQGGDGNRLRAWPG